MGIKPIYIFSLPRSGSTLLQRAISESPRVSTAAEPWLLLPLFGMLREEGTYADYGYDLARRAISAFRDEMDSGAFDDELRTFVLRLYERAAEAESTHFLDKTPRYHILSSAILDRFPTANAILLWRNPLAILASMMETWANGRWNLYRYTLDLYDGLQSLVTLAEQDRPNVLTVQYESLVTQPDVEYRRISDFLEIELDPPASAPRAIDGELGDPTQDQYAEVSTAPLTKWKKTLRNPVRKAWVRRYLRWIGKDRLRQMGYDLDTLFSDLDEVPASSEFLMTDIIRRSYGSVYQGLELEVFSDKMEKWKAGSPTLSHR